MVRGTDCSLADGDDVCAMYPGKNEGDFVKYGDYATLEAIRRKLMLWVHHIKIEEL